MFSMYYSFAWKVDVVCINGNQVGKRKFPFGNDLPYKGGCEAKVTLAVLQYLAGIEEKRVESPLILLSK